MWWARPPRRRKIASTRRYATAGGHARVPGTRFYRAVSLAFTRSYSFLAGGHILRAGLMSWPLVFAIAVTESPNAHGWRHGVGDRWRPSPFMHVSSPRTNDQGESEAGAPGVHNGLGWWRFRWMTFRANLRDCDQVFIPSSMKASAVRPTWQPWRRSGHRSQVVATRVPRRQTGFTWTTHIEVC